jgi:hypothetical protein
METMRGYLSLFLKYTTLVIIIDFLDCSRVNLDDSFRLCLFRVSTVLSSLTIQVVENNQEYFLNRLHL